MEILKGLVVLLCLCSAASFVSEKQDVKEFSVIELQDSILGSRKQPVCVLYKLEGITSRLEKRYFQFWKEVNSTDEYSSWSNGIFSPQKHSFLRDSHIPVGNIPKGLPIVRCYIGYHIYDNKNLTSNRLFNNWFLKLVAEKNGQMPEASPKRIFNKSLSRDLVVVGFASVKHHHALESMLEYVSEEWSHKNVEVLFVHDQSEDGEHLAKLYGIKDKPAIVFIENTAKTRNEPMVIKTLTRHHVTKEDVEMFLTLRYINADAVNKHNYMALCGIKSKFYVPMLIMFHLPSAPSSHLHLSMFSRAVDYLQQFHLKMRFATMNLDSEGIAIVAQHVPQVITRKLPFVVFFRSMWEKTTVVDIEQILITDRPTLSNIAEVLSKHKAFRSKWNNEVKIVMPWGRECLNKISLLMEGPFGSVCTPYSHNATDNNPVVVVRKRKMYNPRIRLNITMENETESVNGTHEKDIYGNWHDRYDMEHINSKLPHVGKLPVVTTEMWQEVIEKSHAPLHPFYVGEKWQGEITKTSLVIFIIADCGNCRRKMPLFEDISRAVNFVDGGAVYLANCTTDPELCKQNSVTGFPTLIAFRGLGWSNTTRCSRKNAEQLAKPVEIEYHGVLMEKYIMDWFVKTAGQAVNNIKFGLPGKLTEDQPVRLVSTLVPRNSTYLLKLTHSVVKKVYPFECLRLACEHLYGQVGCYLQYHPKVPKDHFDNVDKEQELVVVEMKLERFDGFSSTVMKLGKPLIDTMKEEADSNVDKFHKPHKYMFPTGRIKCEDKPRFCTDLMVDFTRDHGRLPITKINLETFHMRNSLVFHDNLPVLIAMVYPENVTDNATFNEILKTVALELYNDVVVVTIDAMEYSSWAHTFVPKGAIIFDKEHPDEKPSLHYFPRFCVIYWNDHHHAAFYPPVTEAINEYRPFDFTKQGIVEFMEEFLKYPQKWLVETEHF